MADENPLFFANGRYRLFGVLHRPQVVTGDREVFVFCHPLAEEKLWTHRVFVAYARRLASRGHAVLRFDYMGNGDSEGAFSESSVETLRSDVRAAIDEARRLTGTRTVNLLGLRFGATIASLVAEDAPDLSRLILWSPVIDGARHIQELLRVNVMTQMAVFKEVRQDRSQLVAALERGGTVNVDGYELGRAMYQGISSVNLVSATHSFTAACLIVQIEPQPKPAKDLENLRDSYRQATAAFAQEQPFWKEIPRFYQEAPELFRVTDEWLGVHA
jgi:uncharacterized protein